MNTENPMIMPSSEALPTAYPAAALPLPKLPGLSVRPGVLADLPFMDALQKLHTRQVGWMPTKQFEGKIRAGHVLVAEAAGEGPGMRARGPADPEASLLGPGPCPPGPVGYLIGNDQYFKRDDVGIIYQLNVAPRRQRGLIGATLLKAQFERSAYGCRLYCCWCAQDIQANHFWEAMGFVPLAFRTGSEKRARTHIFWQKRIRSGDTETPWWFPSKTGSGSLREDRIVLPIPPGTHWSDAKPMVLPGVPEERHEGTEALRHEAEGEKKALTGPRPARVKKEKPVEAPAPLRRNGLMFDIPKPGEAPPPPEGKPTKQAKPKAEKVKRVCDPRMVAAARELRDRWLEQVNLPDADRLLSCGAKYDVSRSLTGGAGTAVGVADVQPPLQLPAA